MHIAAQLENLYSLNRHEESLRAQSLETIASSEALSDHMQAVHDAMDHLTILLQIETTPGADEHTLQLIAIRLFNIGGSTLRLGLSGYYQAAFQLLRDSLEIVNLIDLFRVDRSAVELWRTADDKTWKRYFLPVKVREKLEAHPDYAGQKRDKIYKSYSNYATHTTYKGFQLIAPGNQPKIGPFFDEKMLKAFLEDVGRYLSHAVLGVSSMFQSMDQQVLLSKADFLGSLDKYHKKYIKRAL